MKLPQCEGALQTKENQRLKRLLHKILSNRAFLTHCLGCKPFVSLTLLPVKDIFFSVKGLSRELRKLFQGANKICCYEVCKLLQVRIAPWKTYPT